MLGHGPGTATPDLQTLFPRLSAMPEIDELPALGCLHSPGPHCGLFEAALGGPLFEHARVLLIGPAACLYHARMQLLPRTRGPSGLQDNLLLLPMDQSDTVFGVDDRLAEAVLEADRRFRPELLFLVSTCVPEMMGTDLDGIVQRLQAQVRARLLPVRTDGFSAPHQQLGIRRLLAALVHAMAPLPVRPRTANILGLRGRGGRETELVQLLTRWGVEVACVVPADTTPADIRRAPGAALNIVAGDAGLDLAREMEQRFGIPYLNAGFPLGPDQVAAAYAAIAGALGIEPGPELSALSAAARKAMERAQRRAGGMRCAVGAFAGGALGAARFLADLEIKPVLIFLHRLTAADGRERTELLARKVDPLVARSDSTLDMAEILRALRPDIYAGHADRHSLIRQGIAHLHPDPPRSLWGFGATTWAAEMVEHAACELAAGERE